MNTLRSLRFGIVLIAAGFFLSCVLAQGQIYDTELFSVQLPSGAEVRPVTVDRDSDSATYAYTAKLPHHAYANIYVNEFNQCCVEDGDHFELKYSQSRLRSHFAPAANASALTASTLGGLRGYQQTIRGQVAGGSGLPYVLRWRSAISKDRKHVWILETTAPGDQELSEAASEAFFNSLRIK
jgi:hypothetical protein